MCLPALICSSNQSEKKKKSPTRPHFSQNLDENLKIYLVWPKQNHTVKLK